jgi:bifunctional non-homologous end joining protein LigD
LQFATYLAQKFPEEITIAQRKEKRGRRIYLDYSRNVYGQNAVAPYSVRAKEGAPVATPIDWTELDHKDLHPQKYNFKNVFDCLKDKGNPWQDMGQKRTSLKKLTSTGFFVK